MSRAEQGRIEKIAKITADLPFPVTIGRKSRGFLPRCSYVGCFPVGMPQSDSPLGLYNTQAGILFRQEWLTRDSLLAFNGPGRPPFFFFGPLKRLFRK